MFPQLFGFSVTVQFQGNAHKNILWNLCPFRQSAQKHKIRILLCVYVLICALLFMPHITKSLKL